MFIRVYLYFTLNFFFIAIHKFLPVTVFESNILNLKTTYISLNSFLTIYHSMLTIMINYEQSRNVPRSALSLPSVPPGRGMMPITFSMRYVCTYMCPFARAWVALSFTSIRYFESHKRCTQARILILFYFVFMIILFSHYSFFSFFYSFLVGISSVNFHLFIYDFFLSLSSHFTFHITLLQCLFLFLF